jgi:hypothetical protein
MAKLDRETQQAVVAALKRAGETLEQYGMTTQEKEVVCKLGEQLLSQMIESILFTLGNLETQPEMSGPVRSSLCLPATIAFALTAIDEVAKRTEYWFRGPMGRNLN